MKKSFFRLLTLTVVLCMALGLAACGETATPSENNETPTTAPSGDNNGSDVTPTQPGEDSDLLLNPLTGLYNVEGMNNRPIAFAVPDESSKIVQVGIEHADMYFEAETEAGIPRMLAIFASTDRLPERVGPVRSARPHFIKFVDALDAIYCHIGGSYDARQAIKNRGIAHIESASEVDPTLTAAVKDGNNYSWNNKAFTKDKVLSAIDGAGYRTSTETDSPFAFGAAEGDKTANSLSVRISRGYSIGFTYDAALNLYTKHRVTTSGADAALTMPEHKTGSGGTVAVSNVIVMFDQRNVLDYKNGGEYHIDFELNRGTGLLASGGTAREIVWKRTDDQISYYEADGTTPLKMAEGKTFVCLTSEELKDKTITK